MIKKQFWMLVVGVFLILFVINYNYLDDLLERSLTDYEKGIVDRIIDGDTINVGNESIRLLGINSPEKGEAGYEKAKNFLENRILGKEVTLYFGEEKYDRYYRKLAYVYFDKQDVCLESVREGHSNIYFPESSRNSKEFEIYLDAWKSCIEREVGLCKKSIDKCVNCVKVTNLDVKAQEITLKNLCSFDCGLSGWSVKDEGRKKYVFENKILRGKSEIILDNLDFGKDYVWTISGDSFFLRDSFNGLVSWGTY
jgi:endonuclease YncB( thermonuclease family)